jgi:hypothetical protein
LGDPEIEERDQEGDQHPGDPAEQRGEDDADHRVGEREQHAGDDVGPPLGDAGNGSRDGEGHTGGKQGGDRAVEVDPGRVNPARCGRSVTTTRWAPRRWRLPGTGCACRGPSNPWTCQPRRRGPSSPAQTARPLRLPSRARDAPRASPRARRLRTPGTADSPRGQGSRRAPRRPPPHRRSAHSRPRGGAPPSGHEGR